MNIRLVKSGIYQRMVVNEWYLESILLTLSESYHISGFEYLILLLMSTLHVFLNAVFSAFPVLRKTKFSQNPQIFRNFVFFMEKIIENRS